MKIKQIAELQREFAGRYQRTSVCIYQTVQGNAPVIIGAIGMLVVLQGLAETAYADGISAAGGGGSNSGGSAAAGGGGGVYGNSVQACSRLLGYLQGGFGTLVASAAGVGAIISAALGSFRSAWALLVVSVGCFILRSYLTLFMTGC